MPLSKGADLKNVGAPSLAAFSSELPALPVQPSQCKGSFDCVVLRFAEGNFAQDDSGSVAGDVIA